MANDKPRSYVSGFLPGGLYNFLSRRLTLSGIVAKKRMDTLSLENLDTDHDDKVFISTFQGGAKAGEGAAGRPCLFSFHGIFAKKKVAGEFTVTHLRVEDPPGRKNLHFYNTTDCPLSSNGILKNLPTSSGGVIVLELGPRAFKEKTLWDNFGDELD